MQSAVGLTFYNQKIALLALSQAPEQTESFFTNLQN
jgi:hypothetical protein